MYLIMLSHAHGIMKASCLSFEKETALSKGSIHFPVPWVCESMVSRLWFWTLDIYLYIYIHIFWSLDQCHTFWKGSKTGGLQRFTTDLFLSHQNGGLTSRHRSRYPVFDVWLDEQLPTAQTRGQGHDRLWTVEAKSLKLVECTWDDLEVC